MAEGKGGSFANCLSSILAELGKAEAYPDADPSMIQAIREIVVPAAQQSQAAQDPMAQMAQMMGAPVDPGMPPEMAAAPTRLPRPAMRETQAGIERDLASIQRQ